MNQNQNQNQVLNNGEEKPEEDSLELWVAYQPGEGEQRHYFGAGTGRVRAFKTEQAAKDHLETLMSPEDFERTLYHSVPAELLIPIDDYVENVTPMEVDIKRLPNIFPTHLDPINTLAPNMIPKAADILLARQKARKHRRRK